MTKEKLEKIVIDFEEDLRQQSNFVDYHVKEDRKKISLNPRQYYIDLINKYSSWKKIYFDSAMVATPEETSAFMNEGLGCQRLITYYKLKLNEVN